MSTETTNKKIKIDNGTTFGRTYTDKAIDEKLSNVGKSNIFVHNIHIYYTDNVSNVQLYFSCMSFDDSIITNVSSLNIALGNIQRNISCTGIVKNNDSFFAVTSISWEMRFQNSMLTYVTTSGEDAVRVIDALNRHTPSIDDIVTQIQ